MSPFTQYTQKEFQPKANFQREAVPSIHAVDSFHPKDKIVAPNAPNALIDQTSQIVALNHLCFANFGTNVPFKEIDNDKGIYDTNKKST